MFLMIVLQFGQDDFPCANQASMQCLWKQCPESFPHPVWNTFSPAAMEVISSKQMWHVKSALGGCITAGEVIFSAGNETLPERQILSHSFSFSPGLGVGVISRGVTTMKVTPFSLTGVVSNARSCSLCFLSIKGSAASFFFSK